MALPSPYVTINGTSQFPVGVNVTDGSTVNIALASTAGVYSWTVLCTGTDDGNVASAINATLVVNSANYTATFTAPTPIDGYGAALIFESIINNGIDINGVYQPYLKTTFGVYILNGSIRLAAQNETVEGNITYGWITKFNQLAKALTAGGSLGFIAAGDLSGNASTQTVIGLQNRPIASTAPTSGQVLEWNGSVWTPTTGSFFTAGGDLSGSATSQEVIGLLSNALPSLSDGYLNWTGSSWMLSTIGPGFTAGGDLSGTSTNQDVISITGSGGVVKIGATIEGNSSPVSYAISNVSMGSDANLTLSSAQYSCPILRVTSSVSLTATRNIVLPATSGAEYLVYNGTTGGQSLQFIASSGSGITISNGLKALIYFDGTNYVPALTVIGGDLSASTNIAQEVTGLLNNALPALSDGYLNWTGSAWALSSVGPGVTFSGDLSGTSSSQTVVGIENKPIVLTALATNNILQYNGTDWVNIAPTSIGAVTWANDLSGSSSTHQYIAAISGNAGAGGSIPVNATSLSFSSAETSPAINQTAAASTSAGSGSAGQNLTIQSQAGQAATGASHNGGAGGDLFLAAGLGGTSGSATAGADGYIVLQTGGVTRIEVTDTNVTIPALTPAGVVHNDVSGDLSTSLVVNADVSATAVIAVSKLAAGTSAQVLLNSSTPTPTWTTFSQDMSTTSAGAVTVQGIRTVPVTGTAPTNNQIMYYNAVAGQIQWIAAGSGSGGGTTTADFVQPTVGSNVTVNVNSTVGYPNLAILFLEDDAGSGGYYSVVTSPSITQFTLQNIGGFGSSSSGVVVASGAVFSLAGKDVNAVNLDNFGDGYDGYFNPGASGVTTLTRDMFYSSMGPWPMGSTATINATGFQIFCSGRCNLQNAPANAINWNGVSGGNGDAGTGGTAAGGATAGMGTLGIGNSGGAGGTATEGAGGNGGAGLLAQWSNGGISKVGGAGGAGLAGAYAGGTSPQPGYTPYNQILFHRIPDMLFAGNVMINGGGGGSGGGAGGGNGAVDGAGGGGGGSGGCTGRLNVNELYIDNTTAAGAISVIGGNGGNGGSATAGVGCSGGGGGSGGSGGYLFLNMAILSGAGSGATDVILGSGGNGGNGGLGDSIGSSDGYGGYGGSGGLVEIAQGGLQIVTDYFGANAGHPSGQTGGTGGLLGIALAPTLPQITSVSPCFGSAAGGWTIYIAGSNLSTVSAVQINGLNCTSVTYSGVTGLITAVTPQYLSGATGYLNGSSTGLQVKVILTAGGVAVSGLPQTYYYYLPINTSILDAHMVAPPLYTIGTGVSNLATILPSGGHAWVQSTGGDQPTIGTNFNGTGLNSLSFNGSSDYLTVASMTSGASGASYFFVGNVTNFGNQGIIAYSTVTSIYQQAGGGNIMGVQGDNFYRTTSYVPNGNPHLYSADVSSTFGSNMYLYIDGTQYAASTGYAPQTTGASYLGFTTNSGYGTLTYTADLIYTGVISSTDRATIHSIFSAIYGTP